MFNTGKNETVHVNTTLKSRKSSGTFDLLFTRHSVLHLVSIRAEQVAASSARTKTQLPIGNCNSPRPCLNRFDGALLPGEPLHVGLPPPDVGQGPAAEMLHRGVALGHHRPRAEGRGGRVNEGGKEKRREGVRRMFVVRNKHLPNSVQHFTGSTSNAYCSEICSSMPRPTFSS